MEINLKTNQLNKLFPFHILVNQDLKVKSYGRSIPKLLQVNIDDNFYKHLSISRPTIDKYSFETIKDLSEQLLILKSTENNQLLFRGEVMFIDKSNSLLFLLTPWFSEMDSLKQFELGLSDFAIHDPSFDLLHLFKSQEISTNDAKELLLKFQGQKQDLQRLSLIAKETFNCIVVTDNKAKIQWVNKAFETLTGYTMDEAIGFTPGSLLQGEDTNPETVKYLSERIKNGLSFDCEIINYNKKKESYWIRLSGQPILDKKGNVVQYFAFEQDITEKKLSEQKLVEQRQFYEDVLNYIPSDIAVFDKDHRYLFLNPIAIKNPELRAWLIGKKDEDYCALKNIPLNSLEGRRKLFNQVVDSKELGSWEEELTNKLGEKEYHIRNMYPSLDENGEVKLVIGYGVNITQRKLIEKQLEKNEKRYRDLFNYSQALICTHDLQGKMLSVNPTLCTTLGYKEEELFNRYLIDFIPEKDKLKFVPNYLGKIIEDGKASGVFRVVHKNGNIHFLLFKNYKVEEIGEEPYIIGFSQDITDRIKAEQELLVAKKLTEDSAKAKEAFLANMSHEIRTPMHGILGITSLLAKTQLDEQQRNYIKLITESADNLVVIINDILDIEKIGSGKFVFENIDFVLAEKLNTTIQSFQYKAEEKGLKLNLIYDFDPSFIVKGDPYRLSQILNNLISNALKFTKKGFITINATVQSTDSNRSVVKFSVKDTGIGIPSDKLSIIFNPFVQASTDTTRKYGGTGLGLSICKNLVELQGGNLIVESTLTIGTTFSFTIPFRLSTTKKVEVNQTTVDLNLSNFTHRKVLLAEDGIVNQFLAKVILETGGFEVDIANNGIEAIELVNKNEYDLVLMDIQMPEMDGVTATKKIRELKDKNKSNVPIIALTANALVGNEKEYYEAGMNATLTKPFTEQKLFAVMNRLSNTILSLNKN